MKIKCIKNNGWTFNNLTIGKTYDVIGKTYKLIEYDSDEGGYYLIIDNNGDKLWYMKEYFIPLSEYRNDTINKLLTDEN